MVLLLRRCAWHPSYFNHGKTLGLKWSGKWWPLVGVTHGICEACERRLLED